MIKNIYKLYNVLVKGFINNNVKVIFKLKVLERN